jgi:hypothetical protein
MTTTPDVTATVDGYLSAWNERDPSRRAELIERVWAPDGRLADPPLAGEGHDAISDMAGALLLRRAPGPRLSALGGRCVASWRAIPAGSGRPRRT